MSALYARFFKLLGIPPLPEKGDYYYTKVIDRKCFDLGGVKMLYSSTFIDEDEFTYRHEHGLWR